MGYITQILRKPNYFKMKSDIVNCHHCGKEFIKHNCKIVGAIKSGYNLYCGKQCGYEARRTRPVIIRSKRIGVPNKLNDKQAELLKIRHAQGDNIKELMQVFKISITSVYKYLK